MPLSVAPVDLRSTDGAANNVPQRDWLTPVFRQVLPCRILRFNKLDLLFSPPAFKLFLARDGITNVAEDLVPDQSVDVLSRRKAFEDVFAVLPHPSLQVVGNSYVELMRPAGENVGRISVFFHVVDFVTSLPIAMWVSSPEGGPQILRLRRRSAASAQDDKSKSRTLTPDS